ncbi:hypothetical protein JCM11491_002077 [Sporobolomyces phaffii]
MTGRPRRSLHAPVKYSEFETSLSPAPPALAPAPTRSKHTAAPSDHSSPLSELSEATPEPGARPGPAEHNARSDNADGSTSPPSRTRRRLPSPSGTAPSSSLARQRTASVQSVAAVQDQPSLGLPPLPVACTSLAQDLFPEAERDPHPVASTSTSASAPSLKASKRKQPKIQSESPASAASDNDDDDDAFEPVPNASVSILPVLPALPLASTGKGKEKARQQIGSDPSTQTHPEGPARKRPRNSAAATTTGSRPGSGSNTPALASSTVSTPGGGGGIAAMKARHPDKASAAVTPSSIGAQQQAALPSKEGKRDGGTPKPKETASSFRLGNFLNKKPIAKKPAAPSAPPPPATTIETKAVKPVEPEIPYEEKIRQMKKRREDEKRARVEAEQESIDLYEQVAWMNRYEVEVRDRLNAQLQATISRRDRKTEQGRADEAEPTLPRMVHFGSCFSYWPRDPAEE